MEGHRMTDGTRWHNMAQVEWVLLRITSPSRVHQDIESDGHALWIVLKLCTCACADWSLIKIIEIWSRNFPHAGFYLGWRFSPVSWSCLSGWSAPSSRCYFSSSELHFALLQSAHVPWPSRTWPTTKHGHFAPFEGVFLQFPWVHAFALPHRGFTLTSLRNTTYYLFEKNHLLLHKTFVCTNRSLPWPRVSTECVLVGIDGFISGRFTPRFHSTCFKENCLSTSSHKLLFTMHVFDTFLNMFLHCVSVSTHNLHQDASHKQGQTSSLTFAQHLLLI